MSVVVGLFGFVFAVVGFALTVTVTLIAAAFAVTRFLALDATPAAARGAYRTTSLVSRGTCRTAAGAGRGVRHVAASADSFWKRRGGHARRTPAPSKPAPPRKVRTAEARRPSLAAPVLSVLALLAGGGYLAKDAILPAIQPEYELPSLAEFAKDTTLVYGKGEPFRFDTDVFAAVEAAEAPYVGRTGFHDEDVHTGDDYAAGVSGIGLSHTAGPYDGDDETWSPLVWPGEDFDAELAGGHVFRGESLPEGVVLRSGRLKQYARAGGRFATPQEAFEDLVYEIAYDRDLVTTPVPEADRAATAIKALQMSAERLALVKWPLVVEGKPLGDVYRLHIALDRDQFGEEWAAVAPRGRRGDSRRLAILAGLIAAGTIGLGVVARGKA